MATENPIEETEVTNANVEKQNSRKSSSISNINFETVKNLSLKHEQLGRVMLNYIGVYHNILYNDFLD